METTHSIRTREHDGPPFLLPHHVGWIDVVGMRAQPPFVVSGTLHGLDGEKAKVPSMLCFILGTGFELLLRFFL
jgi:hypothetical protein